MTRRSTADFLVEIIRDRVPVYREYDVPIEGCREAYVSQFTLWKKAHVAELEQCQ